MAVIKLSYQAVHIQQAILALIPNSSGKSDSTAGQKTGPQPEQSRPLKKINDHRQPGNVRKVTGPQ